MKQVIVSWSSGKDSALALHRLMQDRNYSVVGLVTTYVNDRVPFQETPINVVRAQASRLNLPLLEIELPKVFPDNEVYQSLIIDHLQNSSLEIDAVAFGDIYCNGIEAYRRSYLEPAGFECIFPLMNHSSIDLANAVFEAGIVAKVITVDTEQLHGSFVGEIYDKELIDKLPKDIDVCGEDGEFHTLVINMPLFNQPLKIDWQTINRNGRFHYLEYQLKNS